MKRFLIFIGRHIVTVVVHRIFSSSCIRRNFATLPAVPTPATPSFAVLDTFARARRRHAQRHAQERFKLGSMHSSFT